MQKSAHLIHLYYSPVDVADGLYFIVIPKLPASGARWLTGVFPRRLPTEILGYPPLSTHFPFFRYVFTVPSWTHPSPASRTPLTILLSRSSVSPTTCDSVPLVRMND